MPNDTAPEIKPIALAVKELVLLDRRANGTVDLSTKNTVPRVRSSSNPSGLSGLPPGTLILGFGAAAGERWVADASGAPVQELLGGDLTALSTTDKTSLVAAINEVAATANAAAVALDLDPDASGDIEANEVVLELADGSKKQIQAGSDTVEAAIADIDAAFGAAVSTLTTTTKTLVGGMNEIDANADTALARSAIDVVPMAVYGTWGIDVDAARTNGGGLVGDDVVLTEAAPGQAVVENGGVFGNLAAVNAGYSATYQIFPDAPVAEADFCYFGASIEFAEIAFDMATVATFDAAGVLTWQYWNGSAWSTLTIAHDGTSASTDGGTLAFGRDGAILFYPPADWVQSTINGGTLFWVRVGIAAGKAANLTAIPITNSKQHEVVTPGNGFLSRHAGTITTLRASDAGALPLGTTADSKFFLMNVTTGARTAVLTWTKTTRSGRWSGLSLAVAAGDEVGVFVTQEDGAIERVNVMMEVGYSVT